MTIQHAHDASRNYDVVQVIVNRPRDMLAQTGAIALPVENAALCGTATEEKKKKENVMSRALM